MMARQTQDMASIISAYFTRDAVVVIPVMMVKVFGDYAASVVVLDILNALKGVGGDVERGLSYWIQNYALTPELLRETHKKLARTKVVSIKEVSLNIFIYSFNAAVFADYFLSRSTRVMNKEKKEPQNITGAMLQSQRNKRAAGVSQDELQAVLDDYNNYAQIEHCVFSESEYNLIRALFKKGYHLDDFKKVHSLQSEFLRKIDTRKYFVPAILYKLANFEKFLSQWQVQVKSGLADCPIDGAVSKSLDAGIGWVEESR